MYTTTSDVNPILSQDDDKSYRTCLRRPPKKKKNIRLSLQEKPTIL